MGNHLCEDEQLRIHLPVGVGVLGPAQVVAGEKGLVDS
jgi:hypothetical protein